MDYPVILTKYNNTCLDTQYVICQNDAGHLIKVYGIESTIIPKIVFNLANGKVIERTMSKEANCYTYMLKSIDLSVAGTVIADVKIYDTDKRESTQQFKFTVRSDTLKDRISEDADQFDALSLLNKQVDEKVSSIVKQLNNAYSGICGVIANKIGINDATATSSTSYSGTKVESRLNELHNPQKKTFVPFMYGGTTKGEMTFDRQIGKFYDFGPFRIAYVHVRATLITQQPTGNIYIGGFPTDFNPTMQCIYGISIRPSVTAIPLGCSLRTGYTDDNGTNAVMFDGSNAESVLANNNIMFTVIFVK